jgi:hypothetical protein
MSDLRDLLERESERYTLPHDTAKRMFERGERRARSRRIMTIGVSAALFVGMLAILRSSLPDADRERDPAVMTRRSIAGAYEVGLTSEDPGVQLLHMEGRFEMRLSADGDLTLMSPKGFELPGDPSTFEIRESRLTTDALGSECEAPGTYRVSVDAKLLTLAPLEESCELRRIVLATHPWAAVESTATTDPLQGDWIATFSCSRMVHAVRTAPVAPEVEEFWRAALADQYTRGPTTPEDLTDPCRNAPELLVRMFRFADGRLQIFDPPDLQEGFDGRYVIRRDTITISDGSDRNIDGHYRVAFRIDGDRVSFELLGRAATDAFFVGAWEAAPFVRAS